MFDGYAGLHRSRESTADLMGKKRRIFNDEVASKIVNPLFEREELGRQKYFNQSSRPIRSVEIMSLADNSSCRLQPALMIDSEL